MPRRLCERHLILLHHPAEELFNHIRMESASPHSEAYLAAFIRALRRFAPLRNAFAGWKTGGKRMWWSQRYRTFQTPSV